ncbi:hypothetical protein O9929_19660 [Vibrio lentus]|nr:hypothetical protein [Vibrio lentus]
MVSKHLFNRSEFVQLSGMHVGFTDTVGTRRNVLISYFLISSADLNMALPTRSVLRYVSSFGNVNSYARQINEAVK